MPRISFRARSRPPSANTMQRPPRHRARRLIPATQAVASPAEGSLVARLQVPPSVSTIRGVRNRRGRSGQGSGPLHRFGHAGSGGKCGDRRSPHHERRPLQPDRPADGRKSDPSDHADGRALDVRGVTVTRRRPRSTSRCSTISVTTGLPSPPATQNSPASQRLIVVGTLKQPNAPKPTRAKPIAYHIVDPATASWDWSSLPAVVLAAGALLLLGLSNRWFTAWFGRSGRWMILVPVWGAGLYLLFGTLTRFLPASI